MTHSIVFLDRASLGVPLRPFRFPHHYREYDTTPTELVRERLRGVTIAITNKIPLHADALQYLPDLQLIAVSATGTDMIDKEYCRKRSIPIVNVRNYAVHTVPEHTLALIFALRRNLVAYRQDVRKGEWQKVDTFCFFPHPIRDVHGSTLGIIGYGVIGKALASRAEALGMRVLAYDVRPGPGLVSLNTILHESDIVSLHCPLTDKTRNMIGLEQLRIMKRDSILINASRGGLVDEGALSHALREGIIAGAGFDVLTTEPPKQGNVLLDLLDLPNFILTPHVAWASMEAMRALADQLIDNIEAFVAGKPKNVVDE